MKHRRRTWALATTFALVAGLAVLWVQWPSGPTPLQTWAINVERPDATKIHGDLTTLLSLKAPLTKVEVLNICTQGRLDAQRAASHREAPNSEVRATYAAIVTGETAFFSNCLFSLQQHSIPALSQMAHSLSGIYAMQHVLTTIGQRKMVHFTS